MMQQLDEYYKRIVLETNWMIKTMFTLVCYYNLSAQFQKGV